MGLYGMNKAELCSVNRCIRTMGLKIVQKIMLNAYDPNAQLHACNCSFSLEGL